MSRPGTEAPVAVSCALPGAELSPPIGPSLMSERHPAERYMVARPSRTVRVERRRIRCLLEPAYVSSSSVGDPGGPQPRTLAGRCRS